MGVAWLDSQREPSLPELKALLELIEEKKVW
jgi:hypothetical protein